MRRVDERIGLSRAAAAALRDPRDPSRITHSLRDLLSQRIYGLCCGYEDLNDHDALRDDLLMQSVVGRVDALASSLSQSCYAIDFTCVTLREVNMAGSGTDGSEDVDDTDAWASTAEGLAHRSLECRATSRALGAWMVSHQEAR